MKARIRIRTSAAIVLVMLSLASISPTSAAPESQKTGLNPVEIKKPDYERPPVATYNTGDHPPPPVMEAEWKVRRLQEALRLDPKNEATRMTLARTFESLALYHEQKLNSLDAWRYYGAAARVLSESARVDKFKKRIAYDEARAEINHQLRSDYLRKKKRLGFVYTSFQWLDYPKLDRKDALAYTEKVGMLIRNSWSDAQQNRRITDGGRLPRTLIVSFDLHRNGRMTGVTVQTSCGIAAIDKAAVKAVSDAGPMPALLPAMGEVVHFQSQFVK